MTLTQLREIAAVTITVRGQQLAYRDKQTFSERDVLLSSNEDVVSTVTAALYFPDQTGKLVPEERTLDLYEGDTQADAVVRALAAGPLDESLSDALPEGFRVQSIWVEDDICYVNLPSAALEARRRNTRWRPAWRRSNARCCRWTRWRRCASWWTAAFRIPMER